MKCINRGVLMQTLTVFHRIKKYNVLCSSGIYFSSKIRPRTLRRVLIICIPKTGTNVKITAQHVLIADRRSSTAQL